MYLGDQVLRYANAIFKSLFVVWVSRHLLLLNFLEASMTIPVSDHPFIDWVLSIMQQKVLAVSSTPLVNLGRIL